MNNNTNNYNNNNKRRNHYNNTSNSSNPNNGKHRGRQRFQAERPSINKVYDSNGPGGRQRGNASTLYEKYTTLARDASSSGDRVLSENFMQYAEHYLRIVNSIQEQMQLAYREQYSETEQTDNYDESSQNNTQYSSADYQEQQRQDHNIREEQQQSNLPRTEQISEDDTTRDKPIMRRKSYPFARRKPYDGTQPRYNADNSAVNKPDSHEFVPSTHHETSTKPNENMPIVHQDVQTVSSESEEAVRPRRVVRRRPVVKESNNNDVTDSKKPSLDE